MKARGAACFIKLGGFWFVTMTEIENTSVCVESAFFFSVSCFLFLFSPLPFHCRQNKMRGGSISSTKLRDKTRIKLDVLWMSHHFIPVCETTTSLNLIFFFFFPHGGSNCVAHEVSLLTGHQGRELISLSTQIFFVFVIHVIFLSGVAAHQNEIMRPCSMISDKTL